MQRLQPDTSILEQYKGLKLTDAGDDCFVADSDRVVMKLLESDLEVLSVLATADWYADNADALARLKLPVCYEAPLATMQSIVGYGLHHGVMARARRPKDVPLEDLLDGPILVMDGIAKTDNVGAVIRNAAAFGFKHILIDHRTCHPFQRRAVRTSMGNVYGMKVHQTRDLPAALRFLKSKGVQVIGFENRPQALDLHQIKFRKPLALIIGSEATGMSPEVTAEVTDLARIPIDPEVYALNAACASAVALYAARMAL